MDTFMISFVVLFVGIQIIDMRIDMCNMRKALSELQQHQEQEQKQKQKQQTHALECDYCKYKRIANISSPPLLLSPHVTDSKLNFISDGILFPLAEETKEQKVESSAIPMTNDDNNETTNGNNADDQDMSAGIFIDVSNDEHATNAYNSDTTTMLVPSADNTPVAGTPTTNNIMNTASNSTTWKPFFIPLKKT